MGIKSELHEAILKRGGTVPPYGGIAAAMDELNKLPGGGGSFVVNVVAGEDMASVASADKTFDEIVAAFSGGAVPLAKVDVSGGQGGAYTILSLVQYMPNETLMFSCYVSGTTLNVVCLADGTWVLEAVGSD